MSLYLNTDRDWAVEIEPLTQMLASQVSLYTDQGHKESWSGKTARRQDALLCASDIHEHCGTHKCPWPPSPVPGTKSSQASIRTNRAHNDNTPSDPPSYFSLLEGYPIRCTVPTGILPKYGAVKRRNLTDTQERPRVQLQTDRVVFAASKCNAGAATRDRARRVTPR